MILGLSIMIYSQKNKREDQNLPEDTIYKMQLNGRVIIIQGHIQPMIGIYCKMQYWQLCHLNTYFTLMDQYNDVVVAHLRIHRN